MILYLYMIHESQDSELELLLSFPCRQTVTKSKYLIMHNGIRPEIFRFVTTTIKRSILIMALYELSPI